MIKKIVIRDVATYDKEGIVLDDLRKVNFIYGGNGTGKTTLSRALAQINKDEAADNHFDECEFEWEGDYPRVYVYNKDFREKNLRESMPGVFTLGNSGMVNDARSVEGILKNEEKIDRKVLEANRHMHMVSREIERVEHELQEKLWNDIYKPHKDFKELLKGYHKKASFTERIRNVLNRSSNEYVPLTEDYKDIEGIRERYKAAFGDNKGLVIVGLIFSKRILFERDYLEKDFWLHLAWKSEEIVSKAELELSTLRNAAKKYQEDYQEAVSEYQDPTKVYEEGGSFFSSVMPSIESINETLKKHHFTGFSLQPSPVNPNAFQIQREDGSYVKDTLSEGEATVISFLYFMELVECNERGYDLRKGKVVVIDDPISSLDYDAIDLVSTLTNSLIMKARKTKDVTEEKAKEDPLLRFNGWIDQVFVLTHNTTFHQSLSVRQPRRNTRYWRLLKSKGVSHKKAFGMENPVRSDYKEMWMELMEANENSNAMLLPNLMRRIVETYFVDYGGYDKNRLFAGLYCKTKGDKQVVTSLAKWFDEGSHGAKDNLYSMNGEMICERWMGVFEEMFKAHGQEEHYRMMMEEK